MDAEMAAARMAAIKANRAAGRQASTGVNIERFSIPHPSGSAELLTDASLTMAMGRRYGMIGKNGAGKSTLMRQLAGYKMEGLIHLRILLVDQHVEGDDHSALEWVLRADVERTSLLEDETKLLAVQHGTAEPAILEELLGVNIELALVECYERMEAIGVNTADQRARKILDGLGFSTSMMEHPTGGLSGGWAMRAALAAALFVTPDLLLLDEPTNHLDLHALVWLERWLTERFFGMLLVVSHDEVFLDSVCTDILELRSTLAGQSKSMLTHYNGDYGTYVNTINEKKVNQKRLRDAFEKERDKLREFIARDGKKYDNPAHQSQRKMKQRQLAALCEVEGVEDESELVMRFPKPYGSFDSNNNLIAVESASFGYPGYEGTEQGLLFSGVDFCVGCRARIAILGKNGCGKTSLLNLLVGENEPTKGEVKVHLGCRVARLQQHHYKGEQLDPNLNPLEHMRRLPQEESSSVGLHDPGTCTLSIPPQYRIPHTPYPIPISHPHAHTFTPILPPPHTHPTHKQRRVRRRQPSAPSYRTSVSPATAQCYQ
jgi:ATP-binding cassette subfamily F protein 3